MARIVTYAHRPRRPPRKRTTQPAITAAIITITRPGLRRLAELPVDEASSADIRAWLERAKWGRGPGV